MSRGSPSSVGTEEFLFQSAGSLCHVVGMISQREARRFMDSNTDCSYSCWLDPITNFVQGAAHLREKLSFIGNAPGVDGITNAGINSREWKGVILSVPSLHPDRKIRMESDGEDNCPCSFGDRCNPRFQLPYRSFWSIGGDQGDFSALQLAYDLYDTLGDLVMREMKP